MNKSSNAVNPRDIAKHDGNDQDDGEKDRWHESLEFVAGNARVVCSWKSEKVFDRTGFGDEKGDAQSRNRRENKQKREMVQDSNSKRTNGDRNLRKRGEGYLALANLTFYSFFPFMGGGCH